ncbi:MAG TPA: hypothetical protein VHV32_11110, partial [Candidatus Angelobacter sp.]|nr:hypothetical protein [Candidatus Angelobacter sp.]
RVAADVSTSVFCENGRREVTGFGQIECASLCVRFPAEAEADQTMVRSSPDVSLVPLDGGKNIGEDAWGKFGNSVYPVWKCAQLEVQRPDRKSDI